jgi:hypothetical protein
VHPGAIANSPLHTLRPSRAKLGRQRGRAAGVLIGRHEDVQKYDQW